ncbi:MAG: GFA family protein [Devosia sp.]
MTEYPVLRPGPPYDADGTRVRYGGCTCGAVRFELRGEPYVVGLCHCMDCRKATGGVAMASANWYLDKFTSSGTVKEFRGRSFCPECGTRLFHLNTKRAEILFGALDDGPSDLTPTVEGWIIRREHWLVPIEGAGQFERDPT